jgi:4-amino-4-deoxy-L-arabinose transferase-like glycosyltransferase
MFGTSILRLLSQKLSDGRCGLIAALLTMVAALPCAILMPPLDRDESRFVQATAQMLETGNLVDIRYQDQPRYKKPVGIHWFQAAFVSLTSEVEKRDIFPYRLPSMLGAALAAFALVWGSVGTIGRAQALTAGSLFGVSFLLSSEAFIAKTDALLCGLTCLMMAALARLYLSARATPEVSPRFTRDKLIFWLALALAVLVKGPIAPLVLGLSLISLTFWDSGFRLHIGQLAQLAWKAISGRMSPLVLVSSLRRLTLWDRRSKLDNRWLSHLGWGWGALILLLICGPWAIGISLVSNGAFWGTAVGGDLVPKLAGGQEGHAGWPGTYSLSLALVVFPAAFLLGGALQTAIERKSEAFVRFAICWFAPGFLLFELNPTKLIHYPLPTYGGLFWLMALSLNTKLKPWARSLNWGLGLLAGVALTALAVVGLNQYGGPTWLIMAVIGVGLGCLCLAPLGAFFVQRDRFLGIGLLLGAGLMAHTAFIVTLSQLKAFWLSPKLEAALVQHNLSPRQGQVPGPVAILGYAEPSFIFATATKTAILCDPKAAAVALSQSRPVIVEARYQAQFLQSLTDLHISAEAVAEIKGYNYSIGDPQSLKLYRRAP